MENNLTNKTKATSIFWWTVKRYIPVSIAYWILLILALPIIETTMMTLVKAESNIKEYIDAMKEIALYISGTGFAAIAVIFSTIIGMIAFSYMHNKRSVDFFGSLPVSRRTMFFARYIAVIVLTIIPVIFFGIISAGISGSMIAALDIMKVVGYIIIATVGNITMIAFISLCCGSTIDIVISYLALNVAYPICIAVFSAFPQLIIPGTSDGEWSANTYTLFCPIASVFTMIFGNGKLIGIIWWIVIAIVLGYACFLICKKRKAELAQNTYVFSIVEIVVKFIVCSLAGLGFGWIMAAVGSVHDSISAQYIYYVIGLIMGIFISNILLHLIFHRGLVKFSKSLVECGIVFVFCGLYTLIITTGGFGYDIRMPERTKIVGVSMSDAYSGTFYVDGENILLGISTDKERINDIYEIHEKIIENNQKEKQHNFYPLTGIDSLSANYEDSIIIRYELEDGSVFTRVYDHGEVSAKIDETLYTSISDEGEIVKCIPGEYAVDISVNISNNENNDEYYQFFISDHKKEIVSAIKKDIQEKGSIKEKNATGYICINYEDEKFNWIEQTIQINESYVNTIEAIKKYGYGNYKYQNFIENNSFASEFTDDIIKTGKTIYFKLPEGMDPNKEVRCVQGYREWSEYYFPLSDKRTLCKHVSGDIWKYDLYEAEGYYEEENNDLSESIIILQVEKDSMIDSGMILLPKDETNNMLILGERILNKKGKETENDYYSPIYEYEWTKYEE